MILTETGEVGIYTGGQQYVLKPSFSAIAKLGSSAEILKIFASVWGEPTRWQFYDCLAVVWACYDGDADPSGAFGYMSGDGTGLDDGYVPGTMSAQDVGHIARHLLKHGIIGNVPPPARRGAPTTSSEFEPREFAALAVAHLGASERDAWAMSMTTLALALRAKYPNVDAGDPHMPTADEHDETMAWFSEITAAREAAEKE